MKKFLIVVMFASMYVLCSSFAFATEKVTLVEVREKSETAIISFGDKKLVVTSKSEVLEPLSPAISTSATAEFEPMASELEIAEVEASTKSLKRQVKSFFQKERKLNLLFHSGIITMQGVESQSQPTGFATTPEQSGNTMYYSLELKYRWFGFEWRPSGREQVIPYMYNGATLGSLKVTTDNAVCLKAYPLSSSKGNVSVGACKEHSTLKGNVAIGGFPLHSYLKGGGWATKLQFGAQFNVHKRIGLNIG